MQDTTKTSQQPTLLNGGDGLTCSPQDSPVSPFRSPDSERERMMTATSGRRLSEQFTKSGPLGSLVRTLLESSRWFSPARRLRWEAKPLFSERVTLKEYSSDNSSSSKPSAVTLSVRDIPSSRLSYRLVPSVRPTEGTGCGLWQDLLPTPNASEGEKYTTTYNPKSQMGESLTAMPVNGILPTPTARDYMNGSKPEDNRTQRKLQQGWTLELNDMAAWGLLPTPLSRDAKGGEKVTGTIKTRASGETFSVRLADLAESGLLLTPSASDGKRATMTMESLKKRDKPNAENSNLAEQIAHRIGGGDSRLNPLFVCEMMGFPVTWTVSPFQSGGTNP